MVFDCVSFLPSLLPDDPPPSRLDDPALTPCDPVPSGTPSEDPARPPPRLDVLTDSDFCSEGAAGTESEAEHRLTDDMESSGVYSDAESRRSVEPDREPVSQPAEMGESLPVSDS